MASITLGGNVADVRQGGQIVLTNLFETYPGSNQGALVTGVTIGIDAAGTPGGGTGTPVPATSAGLTQLAPDGLWQYTWAASPSQAPGDYLVTWTGTIGSTVQTYVQTVTVAVVPTGSPAPGVYASLAQYRAWSGDVVTPDALVNPALQRASETIDNALIGAVYHVNPNGMPADAMVLDSVMRACCAQVQYDLGDNDPTGLKRQFQSVKVGGVTTARARGTTALIFPPLAPRAAQILHTSGVLPSAALVNW